MSCMASDPRQKGSVLIVVLILMMVSVSLALYTVSLSRDMVNASQQILDKLQAKLESGSSLEKLKYIGACGRFTSWNLLNPRTDKEFPQLLNLRGTPMAVGNSELRLQDCSGRMGIQIPPNILRRLLEVSGAKSSEAAIALDSYLDWTDPDDLKHLNGAEKYFYRSEQSYAYQPRNSMFIQDVGEFELIKGFKGKAYQVLRDEVVDAIVWNFNVNTADATLLSAVLGVDSKSAQRLVLAREKTGVLSRIDLAAETGNNLPLTNEYVTTFPSLTVEVSLATRINDAGAASRAIICFRADRVRPFTVEKFEE